MMSWLSVTCATPIHVRMGESVDPVLAMIMSVGVQQDSTDQSVSTELMRVMEIHATMVVLAR